MPPRGAALALLARAKRDRNARKRRDIRKDPELAKRVAEHIRSIRTKLGLSQAQWAESSGLTRACLSAIEKGTILPSVSALYRLANAIAVSPGKLLP